MAKTISFGLSLKEVQAAKELVEIYRVELALKLNELIGALTDRGAEIAKITVQELKAFRTGALENSIGGYFSPSTGVGIIYANSPYAVYVEFGTGIKGKESDKHPKSNEFGWQHDINEHGEAGWWYPTNDPNLIRYTTPDGNTFGWTKGMPARPFMYETARRLESECAMIAKEVFGR